MSDVAPDTHEVVGPPTRVERVLYRCVRGASVAFSERFWDMRIDGCELVPGGPFVLAPVHRSNIDTLLVSGVVERRMRYMGKHQMWKIGWIGRFFTALGGFPVHRGAADREALRLCTAILESGEPVVMFPEGQRRSGPIVEELHDGPAFVAGRTGAPIVPVGIAGSEGAMAAGSARIRRTPVHLVIGEPLPAPVGDGGKRPSRRQVTETTAKLRERLQELYDEAGRRLSARDRG